MTAVHAETRWAHIGTQTGAGVSVKVFVSYTSVDDRKRKALVGALLSAEPAFEPIVVSDRRQPGTPLEAKVMTGIRESDCLVPILTRAALASQWVNQEIGYAYALDKQVLPIVQEDVRRDLKGFVHANIDLPFQFQAHDHNSQREGRAFRKAYLMLIEHLQTQREVVFSSTLAPTRVPAGTAYTTSVAFRGNVVNGFFDNRVLHQESDFGTWNWDPETLSSGRGGTPGKLNGPLDIKKTYSHSTDDWPRGHYKIFVRLYSHPVPGERARLIVAENEHDFEVY